MSDAELILAAIETAGLSARRFAEWALGRDERTIRRWSAGQVPIPPQARAWLEWWLSLSDRDRTRMVKLIRSGRT